MMGVLSDLVAVDASDAERVLRSAVPASEFGGIDIKGIDTVKFGTLHALLTGKTFEELLPLYDPLLSASDEGPWVFRLPDDLVDALADLPPEKEKSFAKRWARTEEFALDQWDASEVASALEEICELARQARSSRRAVLLWMCL